MVHMKERFICKTLISPKCYDKMAYNGQGLPQAVDLRTLPAEPYY